MKMIKRFKRWWFGEIFEPDFSDYMKLVFVFFGYSCSSDMFINWDFYLFLRCSGDRNPKRIL